MLLLFLASMALLRELMDLGFSPFLALVLVVVIVLWGSLLAVATFFWKFTLRLQTNRFEDINTRLEDCETDRESLRSDVTELKTKVARLEACPRKGCPMRLPP